MGRKERHIVGLDIGSTKVCTLIAVMREGGLEPVGLGIAESRGLKKGAVVNIESVADSIKKSVSEAESMARCEVETVYVGLAGPHIRSFNSKGVTPIPTRTREIDHEDVRRVIETSRAVALSPDREIIHILPQEFTVDDQYGIGDPLGMFGTRLEVNVHIVTSSTTAAQNVITAVNRSGLLVGDTVLEPIAVGEAILTEDEMELGSVLVDIGGGKTNVAIYHHGAVRHTVVVPLGGELFTNDIAVGLRTTIPEAERLKREHGCAVSSMAQNDAVFEVSGIGSRQPRTIAQTVLTGGGSLLHGFVELAEDILDLPVRIGTPSAFSEPALEKMPQLAGPEFTTATGLVMYGDRRRSAHDFHNTSSTGLKKFVAKFRSFL